jgi:hypothetical protein
MQMKDTSRNGMIFNASNAGSLLWEQGVASSNPAAPTNISNDLASYLTIFGTETPQKGTRMSIPKKAAKLYREWWQTPRLENNARYVYVMLCGEYLKIGWAWDPWVRRAKLQASNPYEVELIFCMEGDGKLERKLHELFHRYRHSGEWFRRSEAILKAFLAMEEERQRIANS